jgi:hypothetical protein
MGQGYCAACGASILKLRNNKTNKVAPIDLSSTDSGNIEIDATAGTYRVIPRAELEQRRLEGETVFYTSHFATCPEASSFRKQHA